MQLVSLLLISNRMPDMELRLNLPSLPAWTAIVLLVLAMPRPIRGRALVADESAPPSVGARGDVGCRDNPRRVKRLVIDRPGVYENILVDGEWGGSTLVKIIADNVVLRHCEIRHGKHNGITVVAKDVVIESCKIHHLLAGSFEQQHDAHGITGRPINLTIRNCDIGLTSGDAIQFDPGRGEWNDVLIEHCTLWTGPLPAAAADFKPGQRPGENAVDTKQRANQPRSRMTIRDCLVYGWNQPGQIDNLAALNLKNHVQVTVENCVLRDNEIGFRVRGGQGEYGGAHVTIDRCAVYDTDVAVRAEDQIERLKISRLGIGHGVGRNLQVVGGKLGAGYESEGEYTPPPYSDILESGLPR
jgi:hypothetical protein